MKKRPVVAVVAVVAELRTDCRVAVAQLAKPIAVDFATVVAGGSFVFLSVLVSVVLMIAYLHLYLSLQMLVSNLAMNL